MDKRNFTFELKDKYTPEKVIENFLDQVKEATQGYVIGKIIPYDGPIQSYKKNIGLSAVTTTFKETIVDIQEKLGEQDDEKHRYEVFLTAKNLEHYKYRMMFVNYGAIAYPVTIVLSEALSEEYCGKRTDTFLIGSMSELESMMETVINSPILVTLIQNLINESLRKEYQKDSNGKDTD